MRKGQAALEYLITYGWAFLVILVMISAFAYLGLLNPSRYLPSRCDFGSQLLCHDFKLLASEDNGFVLLKFENGFTEDIKIVSLSTAEGQGMGYYSESGDPTDTNNLLLAQNNVSIPKGDVSGVFVLDLTGSPYFLTEGDKVLVPLKIVFAKDSEGAPEHVLLGEVFSKVQSR